MSIKTTTRIAILLPTRSWRHSNSSLLFCLPPNLAESNQYPTSQRSLYAPFDTPRSLCLGENTQAAEVLPQRDRSPNLPRRPRCGTSRENASKTTAPRQLYMVFYRNDWGSDPARSKASNIPLGNWDFFRSERIFFRLDVLVYASAWVCMAIFSWGCQRRILG